MMRLRFAASPVGHLPVVAARTAVATALFAQRHKGSFTLRIDDAGSDRVHDEFALSIQYDLNWLGLAWDGVSRQSEHLDRYEAAADRLKEVGLLYPCFENEDELRFKREMRIKRGQAPVYDRAMLKLTPEQRAMAEANGKRPYWRFRLTDTTVIWIDMIMGKQFVKLQAVSDPVLIRADGTFFDLFTNAVDDVVDGVTHILRGDDQITATGIQIDLYNALGINPTRLSFGHLPAVTGGEGGKGAKRVESLTLRQLRGDGVEPAAIAGYLARLGSRDAPAPLPLDVLAEKFDLSRFTSGKAVFDAGELLALNRRVLAGLSFAEVAERLPEGATEAFWRVIGGHIDLLNEARFWWDVVAGTIIPPVMEDEVAFLRQALELLPGEPWDGTAWGSWTSALGEATGRKGKALWLPLVLALTGEEHGANFAELLPLIGRARTKQRLMAAVR